MMIRKRSKQRDKILEYMKQISAHVTPEQIHTALNQDGSHISLATVYRNLDVLTQMNEIKKIAHPINGYVYDRTTKPHYHLHCAVCDELYDIPVPYQKEFNDEAQQKSGWEIHSHSITFEGVCPECAKKEKAKSQLHKA